MLSDAVALRAIVLRGCTATEVAVAGGAFLNRMAPIAAGIALPQSAIASIAVPDREPREKVRFLSLVFGAPTAEIAIAGISVYGAASPAEPPRAPAFLFEKMPLLTTPDFSRFYGQVLTRGRSLDSLDCEASGHAADGAGKRQVCDGCHTKETCLPCANCQQMLCGKCRARSPLCQTCQGQREEVHAHVDRLRAMMPAHGDDSGFLKSASENREGDDQNSDFLKVVGFLYELPPGGCDPRILFRSRGSAIWEPETNFVQIHVAFATECDVTSLEINCEETIDVLVKGARPAVLKFEPPGFVCPIEFRGRVLVLTLSGERIRVSGIHFIGQELFPVRSPPAFDRLSRKVTLTTKANRKGTRRFVPKEMAQEFTFERAVTFAGLRFPDISLIGRLLVFEIKHANTVTVVHVGMAEARPTKNVPLYLTMPRQATSVKVWYSRVSSQALSQLTNDLPVPLVVTEH
jgi:hypothetical protein